MTKQAQIQPRQYLAGDFPDQVTATAIAAAQRAGEIQMQDFRKTSVRCTQLLHDVKLETDRRCETAIVEVIRTAFPDHAILSEESGLLPGDGPYAWIVDPLDGTVNFWHGIPFFCVSIACYSRKDPATLVHNSNHFRSLLNQPVAGVVFLPVSQELFTATNGRGALLNDQPIQTRNVMHTRDVVVSVSFGKTPEIMQRMTRRLDRLLPQVRKARCLGAAAAELAYAAAGFLGGVFYESIKLWDYAAAKILIEEAGGCFEMVETRPEQWQVWAAGAPVVQNSLKPLLM